MVSSCGFRGIKKENSYWAAIDTKVCITKYKEVAIMNVPIWVGLV